ncbi:hypothetical protein C2S53_009573 [Perilla frutescens var. hirtella]|uniref:C2 domain-containing protein n=1 Tax=Perilla frutescens var. hirtella TaxID=608512 RepID=A0AAD4PFG0_PERFH|nr:hypothetical protein C2S53_009573 [Perilla frutescens var. hirtella]
MAKASSKTIEVTVISAEELLVNRKRPVKNSVSVTVKTGHFQSGSTGVDPEGRSCPAWNEKLVMELPDDASSIAVEVHSGRTVIGAATIPVTDFAGGKLPQDYLSFVSYRLWGKRGERNGIVNLSVKVKGNRNGNNSGCAATCSRPRAGIPPPDASLSGGVVTGIPVSYTSY